MHKIFELKEMDQEKLVELASELKIKNVKKMSKDDLVYAILDTEAAAKAAHEAEKEAARIAAGLPERTRGRRGRPRKNTDKPNAEADQIESKQQKQQTEPMGQKPTAKNGKQVSEQKESSTPEQQQTRRGRPRRDDSAKQDQAVAEEQKETRRAEDSASQQEQKQRRGRKSQKEQAGQSVAAVEKEQTGQKSPEAGNKEHQATGSETVTEKVAPQQRGRRNRISKEEVRSEDNAAQQVVTPESMAQQPEETRP